MTIEERRGGKLERGSRRNVSQEVIRLLIADLTLPKGCVYGGCAGYLESIVPSPETIGRYQEWCEHFHCNVESIPQM